MDAGSQNASSVPYIGSKISLISNVDIRYEGVLYSINTLESTVALQNVKSFGTEGRRQPEMPPNKRTYQFIIFKGRDIKDLTVCEAAGQPRIPDDPAVVSVNVPPSGAPMSQSQTQPRHGMMGQSDSYGMYGSGGMMGVRMNHQHRMPGYPQQQQQQQHMGGNKGGMMRPQGHPAYGGGNRPNQDMFHSNRGVPPYVQREYGAMQQDSTSVGRGRGGHNRGRGRRVVGELPPQPNQAVKKEVSKAFDFAESNAKFDKSETKAENTKTAENGENANTSADTTKVGYDKTSSFFDRISCETLDRQAGHDVRVDRDKQRKLDTETFGEAMATASRGRGYRRAYGRGGRPRGGFNAGRYGSYASGGGYYPANFSAAAFTSGNGGAAHEGTRVF